MYKTGIQPAEKGILDRANVKADPGVRKYIVIGSVTSSVTSLLYKKHPIPDNSIPHPTTSEKNCRISAVTGRGTVDSQVRNVIMHDSPKSSSNKNRIAEGGAVVRRTVRENAAVLDTVKSMHPYKEYVG
jgi:hypothetical protein